MVPIMTTKNTFDEKELRLLLVTILKMRSTCFDCVRFDVDSHSLNSDQKNNKWIGKRGTFPLLPELEKCLALLRLHINSEETIQLYEGMGFFNGNEDSFFK